VQRTSSVLKTNPYLHVIFLDGVYRRFGALSARSTEHEQRGAASRRSSGKQPATMDGFYPETRCDAPSLREALPEMSCDVRSLRETLPEASCDVSPLRETLPGPSCDSFRLLEALCEFAERLHAKGEAPSAFATHQTTSKRTGSDQSPVPAFVERRTRKKYEVTCARPVMSVLAFSVDGTLSQFVPSGEYCQS